MFKRSIILLFACLFAIDARATRLDEAADFIIFSFNRPLQLYALLESTTAFITGIKDIFVVYRSSDDAFEQGYQLVKEQFPYVHYFKQTVEPHNNFKELTLKAFNSGKADYILFGVDDIVVKDCVDIAEIIVAMREHNAYGCYLRLSPLIDYSYTMQQPQQVPNLQRVKQGFIWQFNQASSISDWGYPHTVDMTIYKKADIKEDIITMGYYNPNTMESAWSGRAGKIKNRCGFCYETSKMVNLPLNLVQNTHASNLHMTNAELEPSELLRLFLAGKKMDIMPLFQIKNRSAHIEYQPTYVER